MKIKTEYVKKDLVSTHTHEGESRILRYGGEKLTDYELKEIVKENDIVVIKEMKEDSGEFSGFHLTSYKNGVLKENRFDKRKSHVIWRYDNKYFVNFKLAHEYCKKNVKGYDFVDVIVIIERCEGKSLYEVWVENEYIDTFSFRDEMLSKVAEFKVARRVREYFRLREQLIVEVDGVVDFETYFNHEAMKRVFILKSHYQPENEIILRYGNKIQLKTTGTGSFSIDGLPTPINKYVR